MRKVDPVSKVVTYGASDCVPKRGTVVPVPLTLVASGVTARIVSDTPLPASSPKAGLAAQFPGPTTLQILKDGEVVAETMGSMREIIGLAAHGTAVIVVFTYDNSVSGKREQDVLGVNYSENTPQNRGSFGSDALRQGPVR